MTDPTNPNPTPSSPAPVNGGEGNPNPNSAPGNPPEQGAKPADQGGNPPENKDGGKGETDTAQLLFGKKDDAAKPADDAAKPKLRDMTADEQAAYDKMTDAEKAEFDKTREVKDDKAADAVKFEDFKIPDGFTVSDEVKGELMSALNDPKLTPTERAQKLIDLHVKQQSGQMEAFKAFRQQSRDAVKSDPVIGGEKLADSVKAADNAVVQIAKNPKFGGSDELYNGFVERLTMLGMGDDRFVIRFLTNVNKVLEGTKDDTIDAGAAGGNAQKPIEDILYGKR